MILRSVTKHPRALKKYDDHVSLVRDGYASFTQRLVEADTVTMRRENHVLGADPFLVRFPHFALSNDLQSDEHTDDDDGHVQHGCRPVSRSCSDCTPLQDHPGNADHALHLRPGQRTGPAAAPGSPAGHEAGASPACRVSVARLLLFELDRYRVRVSAIESRIAATLQTPAALFHAAHDDRIGAELRGFLLELRDHPLRAAVVEDSLAGLRSDQSKLVVLSVGRRAVEHLHRGSR